jgi:2-polyprenyl-3-methyl-5-hydroxy-6-metoxy-1,4-benzoquinol methylase
VNETMYAISVLADVIEDVNSSELASSAGLRWSLEPRLLSQIDAIATRISGGQTILDIGTGPGIIPDVFFRCGCNVISVDFPQTGGTVALKRLMEKGIHGYYAQVGTERLPLANESVDLVFLGDIIEHLPHSPRSFMAEVFRLTRPGGFVVITTPNAVRLEMRLKMLFGGSPWPKFHEYFHEEFNREHHKEYTPDELRLLVEWSGLELVQFQTFDWHYGNYWKQMAHRVLMPVLALRNNWRSGLLAVGRKAAGPESGTVTG